MVSITIYYFRCPYCGRYVYALTKAQAMQYATIHLKTQHDVDEEVKIIEKAVELE